MQHSSRSLAWLRFSSTTWGAYDPAPVRIGSVPQRRGGAPVDSEVGTTLVRASARNCRLGHRTRYLATLWLPFLWLALPSPAIAWAETANVPRECATHPLSDGWSLTAGQAIVDGHQVVLHGGSALAYTDFTLSDFVLELDYCLMGTGAREPIAHVRNEIRDTGRLRGPAISVATRQRGQRPPAWRRAGSHRASQESGAWHHLRIECVGDQAVLYRDSLQIGAYCLERRAGLLALSAPGDCHTAVVLKNIVVTETGYRPLFNGHDLQGWEGAGSDATSCWEVRDGLLVCNGAPGPWLRSQEQFGDFNLRLQYRLQSGGNSGVYVRVPADGQHHGEGAGLEVQILDDVSPRYADLKPYQFSASLYAIAPAMPGSTREVGKWNSLEINCRGTHYQVTHNGVVVVDTSAVEFPELAQRLLHGHFGLQNHNETVWFRQIRIGPPR